MAAVSIVPEPVSVDTSDHERNCRRQEYLKRTQTAIWQRKRCQLLPISSINPSESVLQKQVIDILCEEWLNNNENLSTKLYLVERILPVLVMGLEQLLTQVGKKGFEDHVGFRDNFNPVNFLAQYLMRHNPRYHHTVVSSSSYAMGLKVVTAKLREIIMEGENKKESTVKQQLLEQRDQEEKERRIKLMEEGRRKEVLEIAGKIWNTEQGIPVLQIQQVVKVWLDEVKTHPLADNFKESFTGICNQKLTVEDWWTEQEFVETLLPSSLSLGVDAFTFFTNHLTTCGEERQRMKMKDKRRSVFKEVFLQCDSDNISVVDRQHLMSLFTIFYENAPDSMKQKLTNPRTMIMSGGMCTTEEEIEDEGWEMEGSTVSEEDYQQFMNSTKHISGKTAEHREKQDTEEQDTEEQDTEEQDTEKIDEKNITEENSGKQNEYISDKGEKEEPSKTTSQLDTQTPDKEENEEPTPQLDTQTPDKGETEETTPQLDTQTPDKGENEEPTPQLDTQTPDKGENEEPKPQLDTQTPDKGENEELTPQLDTQTPDKGGTEEPKPQLNTQTPDKGENEELTPQLDTQTPDKGENEEPTPQLDTQTPDKGENEEPTPQLDTQTLDKGENEEPTPRLDTQTPDKGENEEPTPQLDTQTPDKGENEEPTPQLDTQTPDKGENEEPTPQLDTQTPDKGENEEPTPQLDTQTPDKGKNEEPTPQLDTQTPDKGENEETSIIPTTSDDITEQRPVGDNEDIPDKSLTVVTSTVPLLPTGPGDQWSPKHIALSQFIQLCDMFVGEQHDESIMESLATFLRLNYGSDVEGHTGEKSEQIQKALLLMKRARKMNTLFIQWDIDCSGFLPAQELETVLTHWNGLNSEEGKETVGSTFKKIGVNHQVSRTQFCSLIDILTTQMNNMEFEEFIDFLTTSVKSTDEQERRRIFRQQSLAGYSASANLGSALDEAVKAIQQDYIQFCGGDHIGVCIALLDSSSFNSSSCLSYKAASDNCSNHVLGRKLNHETAPVSFQAVKSGRPVYVPDVHKHGRIFFFVQPHSNGESYHGSLVVSPIVTATGQVIGTISIDNITMIGRAMQTFTNNEIGFYQGVGLCLGEVFQSSMSRRKLIGAAEAGMIWILDRCSAIIQTDLYLIKPDDKENEYSLQLILTSDQTMKRKVVKCNNTINRRDNVFREYLFQCVDTSELITAEAYCHPHLSCPLRDPSCCSVAVIDFTLSQHANNLTSQYTRDIGKMVKLLTNAFHHVTNTDREASTLEDDESMVVLFHKLLLADLQLCMTKLNKRAFAKFHSYVEPPSVILHIVQALIMILYPEAECKTWAQLKQYITVDLLKAMEEYQPILEDKHPQLHSILDIQKDISPDEVYRHGNLPAKYLFTWVSACSGILEHRANDAKKLVVDTKNKQLDNNREQKS